MAQSADFRATQSVVIIRFRKLRERSAPPISLAPDALSLALAPSVLLPKCEMGATIFESLPKTGVKR
jgi:hypothetical protein